jgi:hypothetical protein
MDYYHSALAVERTDCCVTKMEHANSHGIGKYNLISCSDSFNEFIYSLILFIKCIRIMNEFIANNQVSDNVSPTSNFSKYAENNVILETPQKPTKKYYLKLLTLCIKA